MPEDENQNKEITILRNIKEILKILKGRIKLPSKKKKDILHRKLEQEKKEPKIKEISSKIVERLKQISFSLKNFFISLFSNIKQKILGIKDSFIRTEEKISEFPSSTKEKLYSVKTSIKNFISFSIEEIKTYWEKKRKEIEESPPFIQKHLINIKPLEKSMMVTAKKSAVFYWIKEEVKRIEKNVPIEIIDRQNRINKLKEEILDDLDYGSVTKILVKCIELARLEGKYNEIEWMQNELNGYTSEKTSTKDIPEYRKIKAILPVSWYIKGEYSLTNEDLEIPFYCVKPINWVEEIVSRATKKNTRDIKTEIPIPKELSMLKEYFNKDTITIITPVSSLEVVLSGIKIRIQEFLFSLGVEKKIKKKKH